MRLGISALLFNLDKALELCREVDRINHIEVGIDNLDECIKLSKYKDEFDNYIDFFIEDLKTLFMIQD